MNVTPVQNNNTQSFGMAFKLKGDGAKKLATALEEVSSDYASRFEKDVLGKIHASKTDVIYDGKDVTIKANSADLFSYGKPNNTTDLLVFAKIPVAMPNSDCKVLQYVAKDGNAEHVFKVAYDKPQKFIDVEEVNPLMQKLFNAREILKALDARAADRAYKAEQAAAKQARIEEIANKLSELYS